MMSIIFTNNLIHIINIEAQKQSSTEAVKLRGTFLKGKKTDLPTMIWFSDLVEPVENFEKFFTQEGSKILDVRNVWLLNYRNMGDSDHHESFDLHVRAKPTFPSNYLNYFIGYVS
jgi:hypothetical protein